MEHAILCWLATADLKGRPNVSPKEIYAEPAAGLFIIADIASGRSVRNIRENSTVCVSLIDIFSQRGRKMEGTAEIFAPDHPDYPELVKPLTEKTGGAFAIRHVISVSVRRTTPILAPSYVMFPERTEAELRADAYRTYRVKPALE